MLKSLSPRTHVILTIIAVLSGLLAYRGDSSYSQPNQPPVAVSDSYTRHGHGTVGPLLANDSDPDGNPLSCTILTLPTRGTLYGTGVADIKYYSLNDLSYTGPDSFTYKACDPSGACSTATVSISITNTEPVAGGDDYNVHGGTTVGPLRANDYDPDGDTLSAPAIVTSVSHGTLYGLADPDRKRYTPNQGYIGIDSFTYKVCDNYNKCATATVTLAVGNTPPVAGPDFYVVRGQTSIGPMLVNDYDPDGDSLVNHVEIVTFPQHGNLYGLTTPDIKSFLPHSGYAGLDTFTYKIKDSMGFWSSPATVFVFVLPNDDAENAGEASCNAYVGQPVNVTNGNMYLQQTDHRTPGVGEAVNVTRTYNSISPETGIFGLGWSTAYDESIKAYGDNLLRLNLPDGRAVYFGRTASAGAFTALTPGFQGQVVKAGDGTFTLSFMDGRAHRFDAAGRLSSLADRNNNQTTLTYGAGGKLASITDPSGRTLSVTSNAAGRVLSIGDGAGTVATYTYGTSQQLLSATYADGSKYQFTYAYAASKLVLTSVADALGNVLESHAYNSSGRATTSERHGGVERYTLSYVNSTQTDVTDALGHVTKYFFNKSRRRNVVTRVEGHCSCGGSRVQTWAYDAQLNVTSRANALNQTTTYTYDASGNRLTETNALGTTAYTYNQFGQVLTVSDPMNGVTTNTYDAAGNLLTIKDALDKTTTLTYNTRGQLASVTDPRANKTEFTYDASGNLVERKDAALSVTALAYDARGRLTGATDALGNTTAYEYDAAGRVKKVTRPDGTFVTSTYDLAGRLTRVTDARNNSTNYEYDAAYRLTKQTDAAGKTVTYAYDLMSNLAGETDQLGRTTNYEYDDSHRVKKITYPEAAAGAGRLEERRTYDAAGNLTQKVDRAGRATVLTYDAANRVTKVTDPALQVTQYEYNARSEMTALVDAVGQRYAFAYDKRGRVTEVTRGGATMTFKYDAAGNRTERRDYNGAVTAYQYDVLNRLTAASYPDATTAVNTYDKLSRLKTAANQHGTVSVDYDGLGRVSTTTDVWGQAVGYAYDANDNRAELRLGGTLKAAYQYDALDRLTQLTDGGAFTFSYDDAGKPTSRSAPNGVATTYEYDGLDRLKRLRHAKGAATLADYQYQLNNVGQITQVAEPAGAHVYGYDAADRLTGATHPAQAAESYAYDAVGNRTSSHRASAYQYQPFNKVVTVGAVSYSYDANGNLTSKTDASGTWAYAWDYDGRLKSVTRPDGLIVSYKYDALGRRVERGKSDGTWTRFSYDGSDVVLDTTSDGSAVEYANGSDIDDKLWQRTGGASPLYFVQDHLNSTRALTDSAGSVIEDVGYDSFGDGAGSTLTRYGYTGRERDPDTGLYYYRARWYDPQAGRFISEDPIGLGGGINLYAYVRNSPAGLRDPLGLYPSKGPDDFSDPYPDDYTMNNSGGDCGCDSGGGLLLMAAGIAAADTPAPGLMDVAAVVFTVATVVAASNPPVCVTDGPGKVIPFPVPRPTPAIPPPPPPRDDEPCYAQYIQDTGWCGANVLDDYLYEQCMNAAWANYIRCKNKLPPKPWPPVK